MTRKGIASIQASCPRTSGMTLVEVMLVVFIIGLVSTLVVLTMPQRPTPERRAAQALSAMLDQAQDRAILTGQPVGMDVDQDGFGTSVWDGRAWTPLAVRQAWPEDVELEMASFGGSERPEKWPDIVLDPTGVQSGAAFSLRGRYEMLSMEFTEGGDVRIEAQ